SGSALNEVPTDQLLAVGALDALDAIQKCTEEKVGVHRNQLGVVQLREMRPPLRFGIGIEDVAIYDGCRYQLKLGRDLHPMYVVRNRGLRRNVLQDEMAGNPRIV